MSTWEERLLEEEEQLAEKIDKLNQFIGGQVWNDLDPAYRELLMEQAKYMIAYQQVLQKRIVRILQ